MENKIFTKVDAVQSLLGNSGWSAIGDEITYLDDATSTPTTEELVAETTRLQTEWDGQEYARLRKAEYDLLNQDEMRYDDMVNGTNTWGEAIEAIKAKYPKPTV